MSPAMLSKTGRAYATVGRDCMTRLLNHEMKKSPANAWRRRTVVNGNGHATRATAPETGVRVLEAGSRNGKLDEIVESGGEFDKNVVLARWRNARTKAVHGRRLVSAEQHQPYGIEHDAQVFQLGDQGKRAFFQLLMHGRIPSGAGEKHHAITQMR